MDRGDWCYSPWGHKESDTTEHMCKHLIYVHLNNNVELTAVQDVLCLYIIHSCGKKKNKRIGQQWNNYNLNTLSTRHECFYFGGIEESINS